MKDLKFCNRRTNKYGLECIEIQLQKPKLNDYDLWDGGRFLTFAINHEHDRTTAHQYRLHNSKPNYLGVIRTWNHLFDVDECMEFAETYKWKWSK